MTLGSAFLEIKSWLCVFRVSLRDSVRWDLVMRLRAIVGQDSLLQGWLLSTPLDCLARNYSRGWADSGHAQTPGFLHWHCTRTSGFLTGLYRSLVAKIIVLPWSLVLHNDGLLTLGIICTSWHEGEPHLCDLPLDSGVRQHDWLGVPDLPVSWGAAAWLMLGHSSHTGRLHLWLTHP